MEKTGIFIEREKQRKTLQKAVLQLFAGCFCKVFLQRGEESEVERR